MKQTFLLNIFLLFFLFSCNNSSQISEEDKIQKVYFDLSSQKCYLVNDVFQIILDRKVNAQINNKTIKMSGGGLEISLDNLSYGWYLLIINDLESNESFSFHINHVKDTANVIMPSEVVYNGWYAKNHIFDRKYRKYMQSDYSIMNSYFGSFRDDWTDSVFDNNGIPIIYYGDNNPEYNPTTIAQYTLSFWSSPNSMTNLEKDKFLFLTDFICNNIVQDDGSAPYEFDYSMHGINLQAPWYSGMAQGQILSVLARAYSITQNQMYLEKGEKVLTFMIKDCKTNLSQFTNTHASFKPYESYVIYEEYVSKDNSFVLNGNLFGLIGLHDFYEVSGNKLALQAFYDGCNAIEFLLPYYDCRGSSCYDLVHFMSDANIDLKSTYAHDYHIALLDALFQYTKINTFSFYRDTFINYYEEAPSF